MSDAYRTLYLAGPLLAASRPEIPQPSSLEEVETGLRSVGYLAGGSTALVSLLATKLGKPVLVEGPAGVGKTELAKALSRYLRRKLVRLQCYEGLDEAKALYEWNYRKQLLRIQTESDDASWQHVQDDIFGEEFLLPRALLLLGASDIDEQTFRETMSVIVKHRTDLDTVAARVGVKLVPAASDAAA